MSILNFIKSLLLETRFPKNVTRKKKFLCVIGVDTEQDTRKHHVHTGTYRNIEWAIPKVLKLFDEVGARATWLITPDVATRYGIFFQSLLDKHEVGCHPHPEILEGPIKGKRCSKLIMDLPLKEQLSLVRQTSEIIRENVGVVPTSFRAPCWGANTTTWKALIVSGYHVDSSVTPHVKWNSHGLDWSKYDDTPFSYVYGRNKLLELPVTIVPSLGIPLPPWFRTFFVSWFRPSISNEKELIGIVKVKEPLVNQTVVLNLMFHSYELVDPNPYVPAHITFRRLETILRYLKALDTSFITMNEAYDFFVEMEGF